MHNGFRPQTLVEVDRALTLAREDESVGVIILTGAGGRAFCSGGDQRVLGESGYKLDAASTGRFHVTDLHVAMRRCPKPIVAMMAGWAIGGGHVLHLVCDLTIAADNARFGQVGRKVGSFDGGYGSSILSDLVGPKKAKEIWMLCRQYDTTQAMETGLVNTVVPLADLETETLRWCREMLALSPWALRLSKLSFHAHEDGDAGVQHLAPTYSSTAKARRRRVVRRSTPDAGQTSRSSRGGPEARSRDVLGVVRALAASAARRPGAERSSGRALPAQGTVRRWPARCRGTSRRPTPRHRGAPAVHHQHGHVHRGGRGAGAEQRRGEARLRTSPQGVALRWRTASRCTGWGAVANSSRR